MKEKWDNPSIRDNSYTYRVVAFKDKKTITVGVTSDKQVSDELKQLPLSLTFTIANASLPQGMKKTITLPSGEVVCDLNGEWDSSAENYGEWSQYGTWPGVAKIIQQGSSFVVIKMKGSSIFPVGSETVRGEFDKSGFKKVKVMTGMGPLDANGQISDDGNKIVFDEGKKVRVTYTRK
jgi:hypothetical protein